MTLRLIGAGVGRTGTHSLKVALETLLDEPCYHMLEVLQHADHLPVWQAAAEGEPLDAGVLDGYAAAVDWPACAYWAALAEQFPDAVVLLSTRSSAEAWWKSASETIFDVTRREAPPEVQPFNTMVTAMLANTFDPGWRDKDAAIAAYERHNAAVRAGVPADRLVEWSPGDGWEPLAGVLGVPVPDEPFPHVNTTADFRAMVGLDQT